MEKFTSDLIRTLVRDRYAKAAQGSPCGCGSSSASGCCGDRPGHPDAVGRILGYSDGDLGSVVEGANLGLGCGNPTAIGSLRPGETVLDLGSGGGFDCFIAARHVGEGGKVIGVDMTPEMLAKARENAEKTGASNVEFRLGEIEHLPVADQSVDVIISNCVLNLSPEKEQVFREAWRVLKPGGRLAISDVVAIADMPDNLRQQAALMTGCIAGAERIDRLEAILAGIGFQDIHIRPKSYSRELVRDWFPESGAEQYVASADIEAVRPV
ncbi:MAG: arsenite methyltransferase [Desulfobacterales bacterium]